MTKLDIDFSHYRGHAEKELGNLLNTRLGAVLNRKVRFLRSYETRASENSDAFCIHLYTDAASILAFQTPPTRYWGIEPERGIKLIFPLGIGVPIRTTEGHVIAELMNDHLFILSNLGWSQRTSDLDILDRLFQEVGQLLALSPDEHTSLMIDADGVRLARLIDGYENLGKKFPKGSSREHEHLQKLERNLSRLEKEALQLRELLTLDEFELEALQLSDVEDDFTRYSEAFVELDTLDHVRSATCSNGSVIIETDILTFVDLEGTERELGEFRITISLGPASLGVRWENLTRNVNALSAPNLDESGRGLDASCWVTFPLLLVEGEIVAVVSMAIQYVTEPDLETFAWQDWPVVQIPAPQAADLQVA